jgi:hypothetical protein
MRTGRPKQPLTLDIADQPKLELLARRRKMTAAPAVARRLRARRLRARRLWLLARMNTRRKVAAACRLPSTTGCNHRKGAPPLPPLRHRHADPDRNPSRYPWPRHPPALLG